MKKPIIFDTSAIHHLANDKDAAAIEAGLKTGFQVGLTMPIFEEIAAAPEDARQKELDACQRLFSSAECLNPFSWIVEELGRAHQQNPNSYDWKVIKIELPAMKREVIDRDFFNDEALTTQQKNEGRGREKSFAGVFADAKPAFDQLFSEGQADRPKSIQELVD